MTYALDITDVQETIRTPNLKGGDGVETDPIYVSERGLLALKSEIPDVSQFADKTALLTHENSTVMHTTQSEKDDIETIPLLATTTQVQSLLDVERARILSIEGRTTAVEELSAVMSTPSVLSFRQIKATTVDSEVDSAAETGTITIVYKV